jgi:hypothetical protein
MNSSCQTLCLLLVARQQTASTAGDITEKWKERCPFEISLKVKE